MTATEILWAFPSLTRDEAKKLETLFTMADMEGYKRGFEESKRS